MKILRAVVIILLVFAAGLMLGRASRAGSTGPLGADKIAKVGIFVKDIEKAPRAYAKLLGVEIPASFLTDTIDKAYAEFRSKPSEARAKLAFIESKNITIELIEPVGRRAPGLSFWKNVGKAFIISLFRSREGMKKSSFWPSEACRFSRKGIMKAAATPIWMAPNVWRSSWNFSKTSKLIYGYTACLLWLCLKERNF